MRIGTELDAAIVSYKELGKKWEAQTLQAVITAVRNMPVPTSSWNILKGRVSGTHYMSPYNLDTVVIASDGVATFDLVAEGLSEAEAEALLKILNHGGE